MLFHVNIDDFLFFALKRNKVYFSGFAPSSPLSQKEMVVEKISDLHSLRAQKKCTHGDRQKRPRQHDSQYYDDEV